MLIRYGSQYLRKCEARAVGIARTRDILRCTVDIYKMYNIFNTYNIYNISLQISIYLVYNNDTPQPARGEVDTQPRVRV